MALSLVLDLVGGEVFQQFTGSVAKAVERKAAFKDLLQDIKYTLASLKRQASVIRQIQQYNLELNLSNNEIIDIVKLMTRGRELIDRLSGIKFRLWNFCCTNNCAEQLKELNRLLQSLFDAVQLEQIRDAKETLILARQNRDDLQKMKVLLEKILKRIDDPEVKDLLKRLADQTSRDLTDASTSISNSNSASGSNTEDEGNCMAQAKSLEALVEAAFGLVIDAILDVKERTKMFRPLFKHLKSTLDCLRPFITEMAQDKKVLDRPKEELENLKIQMENGAELVRKFLSVNRWTSNKKDKYTNQVVELDECLQGHLSILTVEVARNVRETSSLVSNIQEVVNRIRGNGFQGSCDIVEPPIPPVDLEVKGTLVSEVNITEGSSGAQNLLESKGSCAVVGRSSTPTVGFGKFLKRRKDLIKDTVQIGSLFPKRPGQPLCSFYMETGDCKLGLDCMYHHPDSVSNPTGLPPRPLNCVLRWNLTVEILLDLETRDDNNKVLKVGLGVGAGLVVMILCLTGACYYVCKKRKARKAKASDILPVLKSLPGTPREFSYQELKKATNNFYEKHKLGQGGFGVVYRAVLAKENNLEVAVKMFSRDEVKGRDDFLAELTIINRLRHKHLVRLLGWCHKKGRLLIVYEYMPNGSLDNHLFFGPENTTLGWSQMYKIVSGVASALHYLHNEYDQRVIHRNLKASNIMLDTHFHARLGDFGLARSLDNKKTSYAEIEGISGTMGYIAPECFHTGKATCESDVYGFGAVVLEAVCGQRSRPKIEGYRFLVDWVWSLHREGRLLEAMDERLGKDYVVEEAQRLLLLGLACSHPIATERPKTQTIIQIMSGSVPVPRVPPFKPSFVWPSMPEGVSSITNTQWRSYEGASEGPGPQ